MEGWGSAQSPAQNCIQISAVHRKIDGSRQFFKFVKTLVETIRWSMPSLKLRSMCWIGALRGQRMESNGA
jgi:hypothetical protein